MNKFIFNIILIFSTLLFVFSCSNKNYTSQTTNNIKTKAYNFAYLYNPSKAAVEFKHKIYFNSDNSASVYFNTSFNTSNFKSRTNTTTNNKKLILRYSLHDSLNNLCDSATIKYEINDFSNFANSFQIKIPQKSKYKLYLLIFDNNSQFAQRFVSLFDNTKEFSENDFLLIENRENKENINLNNFVKTNQKFCFACRKKKNLKVEYYAKKEYTINLPYQINLNKTTNDIPDSTFTYQSNDSIIFSKSGNYVFCDENRKIFNIIAEENNYPSITILREMIDPLYLFASTKTVNQIKNSSDIKTAIDDYWLSLSKSQNLAKEQIRIFYRRVELANKYFSEDIEGWKSDRGMIYVIFGPATVINLSDNSEEWHYGQDPSVASLVFIFEKTTSPTTKTKYRLIRDNAYQPTWAQAISVWKKGKIFTL